ncbi:MAG TPA: sulfite exporter TauE/SafE family protein, partial [Planctomycetota bacterium]|nr:sulfite exporter TauE/SafE family protein [Planctomycetota bacterium]
GGVWGYRRELGATRAWVPWLLPSALLGGAAGAALLLVTPRSLFERLVPLLILGATLLFMVQEPLLRRFARSAAPEPAAAPGGGPSLRARLAFVAVLFPLAVYGGYFGAGLGILTLAAFGFLRVGSIHEMNALKVLSGGAINAVASAIFVERGLVRWTEALVMIAASTLGGYLGADAARRLGAPAVRRIVIAIGLAAAVWTAARELS